jgi:penicillin V acylase-like amidase (Ntn superfamily)
MVDISYLGFGTEAPSWADRQQLLKAAYWPFDGMNEHGLAVGMMAVPEARDDKEPGQVTISSLDAIRLVLDKAQTVDEALALVGAYHIDWDGGPALHYLLADATGDSAIIEYVDGEMSVLRNEEPWQAATNSVLTGHTPQSAKRLCRRYRTACQLLESTAGKLTQDRAMELLTKTSQRNTMWSVVYNLSDGSISVAMGRQYDSVYRFDLDMANQ